MSMSNCLPECISRYCSNSFSAPLHAWRTVRPSREACLPADAYLEAGHRWWSRARRRGLKANSHIHQVRNSPRSSLGMALSASRSCGCMAQTKARSSIHMAGASCTGPSRRQIDAAYSSKTGLSITSSAFSQRRSLGPRPTATGLPAVLEKREEGVIRPLIDLRRAPVSYAPAHPPPSGSVRLPISPSLFASARDRPGRGRPTGWRGSGAVLRGRSRLRHLQRRQPRSARPRRPR